jgi:hypothetical protein
MIETILERIGALPEQLQRICIQIFYVNLSTGRAIPPASMEDWVVRQFGAVADVREQTIVAITNRLTLESALYNPLRARRPTRSGGGDVALEEWIARELAEHDIFRDPERDTTADVFGRIRGQYCITASNVAKYEGWHGVVIFDEPHPLRFGPDQVRDYLDTALRWLAAAHAHDPRAIYPIITWNCLPKSGATIMHGHMQVALARGMHYARVEGWRRAAESYRANTGASYFADLFELHQALGLAIPHEGTTLIFAHLTPMRNRELMLLASLEQRQADKVLANFTVLDGDLGATPKGHPTAPDLHTSPTVKLIAAKRNLVLSQQLAPSLYTILRRLIDEQGMRAFNLAIALPPIGLATEDWYDMPVVARIADRGDPLTSRSDMGAMELFAANVITADPFEVAAHLRA